MGIQHDHANGRRLLGKIPDSAVGNFWYEMPRYWCSKESYTVLVRHHSPFSMQLGLYQTEYLQCCIYSEQAQESRRAERNRKAIVPLSIEC